MKFIKNWKNYKVAKINPFMKDLAKRKLSLIKKIVLRCLKIIVTVVKCTIVIVIVSLVIIIKK